MAAVYACVCHHAIHFDYSIILDFTVIGSIM